MLNHKRFIALLDERETEHGDIGYHTSVRWLGLGKALRRIWDLKAEIFGFCEKKDKGIKELFDTKWLSICC